MGGGPGGDLGPAFFSHPFSRYNFSGDRAVTVPDGGKALAARRMAHGSGLMTPGTQREGDLALARRVAAGDDAAFDRFYAENVGRVHAVCLRMCGDGERAKSLTQEAFVRAWRRIGSFRGQSRLSSWMHRLAVNVVLESGRRRTRWWKLVTSDDDVVAAHASRTHDPGLRLDLERAIAGLPSGAREMLVLRDVEGHSYEEIATLTGTSLGNVKSQIHRARRLVREALDG